MNKEEVIDLIKKICESKGITAYEISKRTELSAVGIQKIFNGETKNPNKKTLVKILTFLQNWSLYEPPMPEIEQALRIEDEESQYKNAEQNLTPITSKKKGVPYFNVDFSSGYDLFTNNQTTTPDFFIDYEPYNHADLWINNIGNSMSPKIDNGDIVALQKKSDINQMLYGEIYAIVFPEIRTIKYIRKSKKNDHILLVPHDLVNYDEQDMPKNLIKSFFLVLGSIKKFF